LLSAKIIGTGSYLPEFVMKNSDFEKIVETNDEWIISRTGISERHFGIGMENWEMGFNAAQKALLSADVKPEEIDLIIGTTITPDYFYPGLSNIVQSKLGAVNAFCFDSAAACNGFSVGMDIAWQFIRSGRSKKVLIVSSEALSKTIDFTDRSTCVLFGDGAGAVLLDACDEGGILNSYNMSEADVEGTLACRALPPNNPFIKENEKKSIFSGLTGNNLRMGGRDTYKFATRAIPKAIEKVLEGTGISLAEIKYIIPHQANIRIIHYVADHLGIDHAKMYINIEKYGNTSSASIPIALDEMVDSGLLEPHDKVIFVGFGAGLNYGAVLLEW